MTDFNDEQGTGTNEQGNEGENQEGQENLESDQSNSEPKTFTQEQLDSIISERIAEVKNQSAAELEQLRLRAEETIANLSRAAAAQQQVQAQQEEIPDDPEPAGMTPNQKLLWDANKHTRIAMKRMIITAKQELSQSVAPVLNDQTVKEFFSARAYVPDSVKQATQNIFRDARNNGNRAPADQLVQAAYTRALAEYSDGQLRSGGKVQGQGNVAPKPAQKVIVKAPNGSADLGSGTRGITGKIGGSRGPSSGKTFDQLKAELIAEGKMPDNGAGGHFSG